MPPEPQDDGLPIPEVGPWAKRKYHFLARYLSAFNVAMRNKWSQRHYVDLFAGAGLARVRGTQEIVYTSALLAAQVSHPFTQLHLCDKKPENIDALRRRLTVFPQPRSAELVVGDANERVSDLLAAIPGRGALRVAFADPFGLHFDFETARALSARRTDLIVLLVS